MVCNYVLNRGFKANSLLPDTCFLMGIASPTCHINCVSCTINNDASKCMICNTYLNLNLPALSQRPSSCLPLGASSCASNCATCLINND